MCDQPSVGRVFFVGAGPGAGDLITVRGARLIGEAQVVVWPSGVIPAEVVREHAAPEAELVDAARVPDEALLRLYRRASAERLSVVRLVPGDATMWAGLQDHHDACRRLGLRVEIVPGVSTLAAVVAATGHELTEPAVLLTRFDETRPERLAATGSAAVAVTASSSRTEALVAQLRAAGRADDTPVVVAVKPSRPDELVLSTTLGELDRAVRQHRLWLPALFLVGRSAAGPTRRRTATGSAASVGVPASRTSGGSGSRTSGGPASRTAGTGRPVPATAGAPATSSAMASTASTAASTAGAASLPTWAPVPPAGVPHDPLHRSYRRRRRTNAGG